MSNPAVLKGVRVLDFGKFVAGPQLQNERIDVVADFDGVVVIPQEAIHETVRMASDKAGRENESRRELLKGAFLRDVFEKYGVL